MMRVKRFVLLPVHPEAAALTRKLPNIGERPNGNYFKRMIDMNCS